MTPSLPIDWWQLRKLHNRTLSETPMNTLPDQSFDCLAMNLTSAVQHKGYTIPPNQKLFGFLLNGHFCPPPLTTNFPRALRAISNYLYNIFVNRIRFYWIGEKYTSVWLIDPNVLT